MEKRLFIAEASNLISLIEGSENSVHQGLPIDAEEIANYWVNDLLRVSGKLPVPRIKRYLDETETYCTLDAYEANEFKTILFHTIEKMDLSGLGVPTVQHRIRNGALEFYILRG